MEEAKYKIKSRFFRKKKELIINKNFLKFGDITIPKEEIEGYRYGLYWIQLDLTFGREYKIIIQCKTNKILKINFRSYFGRNIQQCHHLYTQILQTLWQQYFYERTTKYLSQYNNNISFSIGSILFMQNGISIKHSLIKETFIPWEQVQIKDFQTYLAVYSSTDPSNINFTYDYMEDWNITIIYSILKTILEAKKY